MGGIGFPLLYYYLVKLKSAKRNNHSKCGRCGNSLRKNAIVISEGIICQDCYKKTFNNQQAGYRFFIGLAITGIMFGSLGIYSDYKRGLLDNGAYFNDMLNLVSTGALSFITVIIFLKKNIIKKNNSKKDIF